MQNYKFKLGDFVKLKGKSVQGKITELKEIKGKILVSLISGSVNFKNIPIEEFEPGKEGIQSKFSNTKVGKVKAFKNLKPLDLHALRFEEAENRTHEYLYKAIESGSKKLQIIHGIGKGRVREAVYVVLEEYKRLGHIAKFELNPKNSGETIIYLY